MFESLRKELKKQGLNPLQLSQKAGISSSDLYQALQGKKPFYPGWRKRISEALGKSEEDLFPEYDS